MHVHVSLTNMGRQRAAIERIFTRQYSSRVPLFYDPVSERRTAINVYASELCMYCPSSAFIYVYIHHIHQHHWVCALLQPTGPKRRTGSKQHYDVCLCHHKPVITSVNLAPVKSAHSPTIRQAKSVRFYSTEYLPNDCLVDRCQTFVRCRQRLSLIAVCRLASIHRMLRITKGVRCLS